MRIKPRQIIIVAAILDTGSYRSITRVNTMMVRKELIRQARSVDTGFTWESWEQQNLSPLNGTDPHEHELLAALADDVWGLPHHTAHVHVISTGTALTYGDIDLIATQLGTSPAELTSLTRDPEAEFIGADDPHELLPREYAAAVRLRLDEHNDAMTEIAKKLPLSDVWNNRSPRWVAEAVRGAVLFGG